MFPNSNLFGKNVAHFHMQYTFGRINFEILFSLSLS